MSDALDTASPYDLLARKRQRGGKYGEQLRALSPEEQRQRQLGFVYDVASFAPVTGEAIAAKEAKEFYDQGNYGMMTLAGLGAIPLGGAVLRPFLKTIRNPSLKGNVLAGQSNYIDNYYAPSQDIIPSSIENKIAETFLKIKGQEVTPSLVNRTAQAGKGLVKWAADAPLNVLDAVLNPASRALYKETGINRRSQKKIKKLLEEGSSNPKQMSRLLDKATAQGIYNLHLGEQAGRLGRLSPEMEELASYAYLGDAYVPVTKENFIKGVKQTETFRNGKKLYVSMADLEQAYDLFKSNFNLREGAKLVIKQPTGKSGNHLGDLITKNPTNAFGRKAAENLKKAGKKRTPNNWLSALVVESKGGKNFQIIKQDSDGGVWVRSGTKDKPFIGSAVVEGGVAGYSKMYPNGNTISFMYDQHDFLEKLPAVGKILEEVLPNDVVAVAGPIHHNIFSNKWGKNLEYRQSGSTAQASLKKDPDRLNQKELEGLLTRISAVRPSGKATAEELAKIATTGTILTGGGMLVKDMVSEKE